MANAELKGDDPARRGLSSLLQRLSGKSAPVVRDDIDPLTAIGGPSADNADPRPMEREPAALRIEMTETPGQQVLTAPSIVPRRMTDAHVIGDPEDLSAAFAELEQLTRSVARSPADISGERVMAGAPSGGHRLDMLPPADFGTLQKTSGSDPVGRSKGAAHRDEEPGSHPRLRDEDAVIAFPMSAEPRRGQTANPTTRLDSGASKSGEAGNGYEKLLAGDNPLHRLARIQDKMKAERDHARGERDEIKARFERLMQDYDKADAKIDALKEDLAGMRRTISDKENHVRQLEDKLATYTEIEMKFQSIIARAKAASEEATEKVSTLEKQLAAERRKNADLMAAINDMIMKADMP
jgi:uncharacterized protein YoxC